MVRTWEHAHQLAQTGKMKLKKPETGSSVPCCTNDIICHRASGPEVDRIHTWCGPHPRSKCNCWGKQCLV